MKNDKQSFRVPDGQKELRADKFIANKFTDISRQKLQESFDAGKVWCNGQAIRKKYKVKAGDEVSIELPEIVPISIKPVEMPLDVLYEDDDIIIINKTSGIIVHPGNGVHTPTLVDGLLHYTMGKLARAAGSERLGVVHRLDRDTSGAIVFTKTDAAYYKMTQAFANRQIHKEYLAIIVGAPKESHGSIKLPLIRHPVNRTKMCVAENGRIAHTEWSIIENFNNKYALVKCRIYTGRTHQIRVHMAHLHHPIWGDCTYGYKPAKDEPNPPERFLLHAKFLAFQHPINHKQITIDAPLPLEFNQRLRQLKTSEDTR